MLTAVTTVLKPFGMLHHCCLNDFKICSSFLSFYVFFSPETEDRPAKRFSPAGVFNFTSLLLSPEDNKLYIGAREVLFAINLSDISRLQLHRNVSWCICFCAGMCV